MIPSSRGFQEYEYGYQGEYCYSMFDGDVLYACVYSSYFLLDLALDWSRVRGTYTLPVHRTAPHRSVCYTQSTPYPASPAQYIGKLLITL